MKKIVCLVALVAAVTTSHATLVVSPNWTPLFQGIDQKVGTNFPSTTVTNNGAVFTDSSLQVAHCIRVDLTDPGVQLFTTPRATNWSAETRETLSLSISNFIKKYAVQVAVDANFYSVNPGGSDPTSEGLPSEVDGLLISKGVVVSPADNNDRYASMMFTTNKVPILDLNNRPPGTNTAGIYTAVTGFYPVLTNGVNVWALYSAAFTAAYPDSFIHQQQPRTAFGLSQDKRYLFLMTIDGRQGGYSDGAVDVETAMWMLQFGAWDALNMDGGGSTAMYRADCAGNPAPVNHSSYVVAYGRERILGDHFGVYAQPLPAFINNVVATPAMTTAEITWTTVAPASSQIEYGLTSSYGTFSALDSTLVTSHDVTLSGLTPGKQYFYRTLSSDGATNYNSCAETLFTTNNEVVGLIFDLTQDWRYNTNNLDGGNWKAPGYDDSAWTGHGPGLLWVDTRQAPNPNNVQPENTRMPPFYPDYPYTTYYFRTHFNFTNSLAGVTLTFSNYIDDGAVFYLNGTEINRAFLPNPAVNSTLAIGTACTSGDATCPYVFTVSGNNLQSGDNVVAVEVHNKASASPDITFGQALFYTAPPPPPPPFISDVVATPGETTATITWTTLSNATSRVAYSLTTNLNKATPLDTNMVTSHSVTLTGLTQLTNYYFRVISSIGATQYTANGSFSTVPFYDGLVSLNNIWSYSTTNENGINWQARSFDESLFQGQGPALLYIENNPAVAPKNTLLPAAAGGAPFPTYYFRTHFTFDTNLAGLSLVFTNYIDDGAIFYLNGHEVQRVRLPAAPQPVLYTDSATSCPHPVDCDAVTNAPDIFRISGDLLTNLVAGGDNVLAAEVHQAVPSGSDIVFGSAVGFVRALVNETELRVHLSGNVATISWDGSGFTLQQTHALAGPASWSDVAPAATSPYSTTNPPATTFYRLRN